MTRAEWLWTFALAAVVSLVAAAITVPLVVDRTFASPDVANYLGVANAFAHDAGFVEPIQWHYYLPGSPPQPAFAFLSPIISLVLAVPIHYGSSVTGAIVVHAVVASLIGGASVVVARRFMGLPAAAMVGMGLAWSQQYSQVTYFALTEPYAILALLLMIATAPGVARSHRGALLCALVTVFAWMSRANLPALALAIVVAVVWSKGLRAGLRHAPLWTYLGASVFGIYFVATLYEAETGMRPYANYDAFFEMFISTDLTLVDKQYVGAAAFIRENWDRVVDRWFGFASTALTHLCLRHTLLFVGWLLPLVATFGLFGHGDNREHVLLRRVASFGALGFLLQTVLTYGGYETRYLLPCACCAWLAGSASIEALLARRSVPRALRALPLLVVFVVAVVGSLAYGVVRNSAALEMYRARGYSNVKFKDPGVAAFCRLMNPRHVAIAKQAESVHFYCGNPTMRLPLDLNENNITRFLRERNPLYFLVHRKDAEPFLNFEPLRVLGKNHRYVLFEVANYRGQPVWEPPPSLACLGDPVPPTCPEQFNARAAAKARYKAARRTTSGL